jgi:hypothetical protein
MHLLGGQHVDVASNLVVEVAISARRANPRSAETEESRRD